VSSAATSVFQQPAGGRDLNVLDPVTIGPDGTAYVGTKNGLMAIRDGGSPDDSKKPKKDK